MIWKKIQNFLNNFETYPISKKQKQIALILHDKIHNQRKRVREREKIADGGNIDTRVF